MPVTKRYDMSKYMSKYIKLVRNPYIRNTIIRLRIDANKLEDCKFRNPRYQNIKDDKCIKCDVHNDVKHTIYICKKDEIVKARNKFIYRYSRLNANMDHSENIPSITELLNLEPNVAHKYIDLIGKKQ